MKKRFPKQGRFGDFGGRYIPETLVPAIEELEENYLKFKDDKNFKKELEYYLKYYAGRPTPLYFAKNLTEKIGGAKIYLKREDLLHGGAHKITPYNPLQRDLRLTLKISGAKIVAIEQRPQIVLHIDKEDFSQHPISVSTQGITQENSLIYQLTFSLSNNQDEQQLTPRTIVIERRAYYDPNDLLSSKEEARVIMTEMRNDAINQLLRQLIAFSRDTPRAHRNETAH